MHPDQIASFVTKKTHAFCHSCSLFHSRYVTAFMIATEEYILWENLRLCRIPKSEISLIKSYSEVLWSLSLLRLLN